MTPETPDSPEERMVAYLEREGATSVSRVAEDLDMPWEDATEHAMQLEDAGRIRAEYAAGDGLILSLGPENSSAEDAPGSGTETGSGRAGRGETGDAPSSESSRIPRSGVVERETAARTSEDAGNAGEDVGSLQETVHELSSRVESMRQTLDVHQQRIDRVNASQAVFEREIAELMQDHRGIIADLRGQHRSTQRRIDMLFEALEEGMAEADDTVHEAIRDIRETLDVDYGPETEALEDEMDLLRDKIDRLEERKATAERIHTAVDEELSEELGEEESLSVLADTIRDTQERVNKLEQRMEERLRAVERDSPTVVE